MTAEHDHPSLLDRVALVTGAGSGIGRAIAHRLAQEGAAVVLFDRDPDSAELVRREFESKDLVCTVTAGDVAIQSDLDTALAASETTFGTVPEIVVCNAGDQTFTSIWNLQDDEWDRVFDTNVRGTFLTLRTFGSALRSRGEKGSMVTISSVKARFGSPLYAHYAASKAAVLSLTRSFAVELASAGIRVNSVAPGAIRTPLWERASVEMAGLTGADPEEMKAARVSQIPLERFGEPEEIAGAVAYLASDDSSYLTGETIHVCGGDLMM